MLGYSSTSPQSSSPTPRETAVVGLEGTLPQIPRELPSLQQNIEKSSIDRMEEHRRLREKDPSTAPLTTADVSSGGSPWRCTKWAVGAVLGALVGKAAVELFLGATTLTPFTATTILIGTLVIAGAVDYFLGSAHPL